MTCVIQWDDNTEMVRRFWWFTSTADALRTATRWESWCREGQSVEIAGEHAPAPVPE